MTVIPHTTKPLSGSKSRLITTSLSETKLFSIIDQTRSGVLVFNTQGHILLFNSAAHNWFDKNDKLHLGQHVVDFFSTVDPETALKLEVVLESQQECSGELVLKAPPPKSIYSYQVYPVYEDGGISEWAIVFHDITAIRNTEKMRRDFVANVSHELRTPLSAINGYAETLLDGALEDHSVAHDFVQIIYNHSQRLSSLVRDLLDLSKLESTDTADLIPVHMGHVVQKVLNLSHEALVEKQLSSHFTIEADNPWVKGNQMSLEQVIANLIENAIKYSKPGGSVSVRIFNSDDMIQVDVEDTGFGIEQKYWNRIFERFYRVDKARSREMGGTGLGLAIVKHIVQHHGGDVWVTSVPEEGSTFSFTLQPSTSLPEDSYILPSESL